MGIGKEDYQRPKSVERNKNNVIKVSIDKEKPCGIYLSDWDGVVNAVRTFAEGNFQMKVPEEFAGTALRAEVVRRERVQPDPLDPPQFNQYSHDELVIFSTLEKRYKTHQFRVDENLELAKKYLDTGQQNQRYGSLDSYGVWQIRKDLYAFPEGAAFYGVEVTIEGLTSKKNENFTTYEQPYLLSIHSEYQNDPEEKLAQALQLERAILPRNITIELSRKSEDLDIDFTDTANRLNTALQTKNTTWGKAMKTTLLASPDNRYSLGNHDGFEVKVSLHNTRNLPNWGYNEKTGYLDESYFDFSYKPTGVQIEIGDATLEALKYRLAVIPPEKKQKARALAEKIKNAFLPNV